MGRLSAKAALMAQDVSDKLSVSFSTTALVNAVPPADYLLSPSNKKESSTVKLFNYNKEHIHGSGVRMREGHVSFALSLIHASFL